MLTLAQVKVAAAQSQRKGKLILSLWIFLLEIGSWGTTGPVIDKCSIPDNNVSNILIKQKLLILLFATGSQHMNIIKGWPAANLL
jgi:hypothetical protein